MVIPPQMTCVACLAQAHRLESENAALKQELEKLKIQSLDAFDKQRQRYEQERDRYKAALEKIGEVQLRPELGQIVDSEHYEAAWLDCAEIAKEALNPPEVKP